MPPPQRSLDAARAVAAEAGIRPLILSDISNNKGVKVPGVIPPISALSDKDREDLASALEIGVDWVTLFFVQRAGGRHRAGGPGRRPRLCHGQAGKAVDDGKARRHRRGHGRSHGGARRPARRAAFSMTASKRGGCLPADLRERCDRSNRSRVRMKSPAEISGAQDIVHMLE